MGSLSQCLFFFASNLSENCEKSVACSTFAVFSVSFQSCRRSNGPGRKRLVFLQEGWKQRANCVSKTSGDVQEFQIMMHAKPLRGVKLGRMNECVSNYR